MKGISPSLFLSVILFLNALCGISSAQTRGGTIGDNVENVVRMLNYHALLIGIDKYMYDIPGLQTSVNDVKAVEEVLVRRYGFSPGNIITLTDQKATRANIMRTLRELSISLNETDALLIYYAGHGIEDPATEFGYWIPADARREQIDTYIPNSDIRGFLRAIKARHIFLISDSCFSGKLLAQRALPGAIDGRFFAKKAAGRSRIVLTSGGNEPVMDQGKGGHSIFGYFFLKVLDDFDERYLTPTRIFVEVGPLVGNNAQQTPQWGALRDALDEGGELVMVNQAVKAPPPTASNIASAAAVPEKNQEAPEDEPDTYHKALGWTSIGVGSGLMILGGVCYGLSEMEYDTFTSADNESDANDARTTGQTYEIAGMAGLGLGVAAVGVGIYALLTDPNRGNESEANAQKYRFALGTTGRDHFAAFGYKW